MKVVFLLGIVLVIAAAVANAEEDHKKKHDRSHGLKDHKEHKDRNHGKDRSKKEHKARGDRHAEKHDGKKDRHHKDKKHSDKHVKNVVRSAHSHKVHLRDPAANCPANKEACCLKDRCVLTCAEVNDTMRKIQCAYENWWNTIIDKYFHRGSGNECKPGHENYKCICKDEFFLNDGNCVEEEECRNEKKPEGGGGDGEDGEDDEGGKDGEDGEGGEDSEDVEGFDVSAIT